MRSLVGPRRPASKVAPLLATAVAAALLSTVARADDLSEAVSKAIYMEWAKGLREAGEAAEKAPKSRRPAVYRARADADAARIARARRVSPRTLTTIAVAGVEGGWPTESPIDSIRAEEFYNDLAERTNAGRKVKILNPGKFAPRPGTTALVVGPGTPPDGRVSAARSRSDLLTMFVQMDAGRPAEAARLRSERFAGLPVGARVRVEIVGRLRTGYPTTPSGPLNAYSYAKIKLDDKYYYIDATSLTGEARPGG